MSKSPVLFFGFTPSAAAVAWRLSEAFDVHTNWPNNHIDFSGASFAPAKKEFTKFDGKKPSVPYTAVVLAVNTLADVPRACKQLAPALSKSTVVLVDVTNRAALQKYVKARLPSGQTLGVQIDSDAAETDTLSVPNAVAAVKITANKVQLLFEPGTSSGNKVLSSLEQVLSSNGASSSRSKSVAAFAEIQWTRAAGLALEVLARSLDIEGAKLKTDVLAKPLRDGVLSELASVASACGAKSLLSTISSVVPASTNDLAFARDFVLLLSILLSDELPKGGATPYLECVYAFSAKNANATANAKAFEQEKEAQTREVQTAKAQVEDLRITLQKSQSELGKRSDEFARRSEDMARRHDEAQRRNAELCARIEELEYHSYMQGQAQAQMQPQMQMQMQGQAQPVDENMPAGVSTPNGTVYSRFDPTAPTDKAAQAAQAAQTAQTSQANYNQANQASYPNAMQNPAMNAMQNPANYVNAMNYGVPVAQMGAYAPYGAHNSSSSISSSVYNRKSYNPPPRARAPMNQPRRRGQSQQFQQRRPEEFDMMSMTAARARHRSVPNGVSPVPSTPVFSQEFQLDGVMESATDRYHFVSRARGKPKDPKLSSDDAVFQARRRVQHGGASGDQEHLVLQQAAQFNPAFLQKRDEYYYDTTDPLSGSSGSVSQNMYSRESHTPPTPQNEELQKWPEGSLAI